VSEGAGRRGAAPFVLLALAAGGGVFRWALERGRVLLYGDATAHLAIARRMVDSATPGLSQWGTVWLPLPHLLMALTVWHTAWWRNGVAGALPSLAALALATGFLHRIARRHWGAGAAAWAAAFFCLNPSLLYLSAVPMTESVYLAAFLGMVDACSRFSANPDPRLAWQAGAWGLAGSLCRYDGWFALPFALAALLLASGGKAEGARRLAGGMRHAALGPRQGGRGGGDMGVAGRVGGFWGRAWGAGWRFCLVAGAGPVLWLIYNWWYLDDPLAFARGPYSARQIYLNALRQGGARYPGDHALAVATLYFFKTVVLTCGVPLMAVALLGLLGWRPWAKQPAAWLLLLPLPWYLWAMWTGNVPVFVPQYWPHGYYNVRYGVQLLPAVAAFSGMAVAALGRGVKRMLLAPGWRASTGAVLGVGLLCGGGYAGMLGGTGPIAYAEAVHNAPARLEMEHALAQALTARRPGERILMYYGTYPGALADDGIAVREVVQESNFLVWQDALFAPHKHVDWVVAEARGPVAKLVNRRDLGEYFHLVATLRVASQPTIEVYRRNEP